MSVNLPWNVSQLKHRTTSWTWGIFLKQEVVTPIVRGNLSIAQLVLS